MRSGRIEHQTAASEPEHGARCVVPQRSLTLRLGLRTVRKQTQQFRMHASGYSPIESSSSLTSWPTWLNPITESCNGTSKLDLCIIIAIVTRALCTVVCIGQGIIIPNEFPALRAPVAVHTRQRDGQAALARRAWPKDIASDAMAPLQRPVHPFS